jgi:hypothetical protein
MMAPTLKPTRAPPKWWSAVAASAGLVVGTAAACLLCGGACVMFWRRRRPRHRGAFHGDYSSDPGAFLFMDPTGTQITSPLRDSMPEEWDQGTASPKREWGFSLMTPDDMYGLQRGFSDNAVPPDNG